jgi:hypothetical protein
MGEGAELLDIKQPLHSLVAIGSDAGSKPNYDDAGFASARAAAFHASTGVREGWCWTSRAIRSRAIAMPLTRTPWPLGKTA